MTKPNKPMNIVFSTTRQWNPGDEFILMGSMNLLRHAVGEFNPIIYNRNPQIRRARRHDWIKRIDNLLGKDFLEKFLDNSVKDRLPMDYADMVVFAGSPEWRGLRMTKLYRSIREYQLPTLFMGLGTSGKFTFDDRHFTADEQAVFKAAKLITCRDTDTKESLQPLPVHQLPCPALFSSPTQQQVKEVKRIGLIYGTKSAVACNNVSEHTHDYLMQIYRHILARYGDSYEIEFVAHYIDELSPFPQDFPGQTLRYSFDSKDYLEIFGRYDLVIGHRVHGIGISASQGIPGIMIAHDPRAVTVKGFQAAMVPVGAPLAELEQLIDERLADIGRFSQALLEHKAATQTRYLDLFAAAGL
ncbi:polysaccharide pyruvyl transferase family protein [Pseudaeromonas paramecii]|uniref:Polysaccharide pyruvyl transferase domain-containing protein n=1 Tax=Pseudaeromonas paramecii TaxID=2138166 RepID=A0ABP8PXJ7_9GAMM